MENLYENIKKAFLTAHLKIQGYYADMVQRPGESEYEPGQILGLIIEARTPFIKHFEFLTPSERERLNVLDFLVERSYHNCLEFSWSEETRSKEKKIRTEENDNIKRTL